ncbi:hypothetical protein B0I00_2270 [Novosphingobium kunmingense]|uniref:WYL domain-containing protein n=1 Tax=Novosphingobium kunmingense TaxID=1211806 RepID=A0A2N0H6Y0_9SPHN|nr:hypothetical protein [Novosphingobium kunmingense]PKB14672.1 hypothetical protein B0I00_2270 [Novosphingobium kunmingense]
MQHAKNPTETDERKFLEAIARRILIRASYNGTELVLAPHHLFERHDELYVGALNTGKAWRSDDERRLGYFKLKGLTEVALTDDSFEPLELEDSSLPRPEDRLLFAV